MVNTELSLTHQKLHAFNRILSAVIRVGIVISLVMIIIGLILYSIQGNTAAGKLTSLISLPAELVKLSPAAFITLGLISLLLMPPAILLASFAHFIAARQKKPVIVCTVLLVLLIISLTVILTVR